MDRRTFLIGATLLNAEAGLAGAGEEFRVERRDGSVFVGWNGRPVFQYRQTPVEGPAGTGPLYTRGAYIHPLHAPNGAVVTDDFPPDHLHQRGVFFAWTRARVGDREPDFWNLGDGKGRIRSLHAVARGGETASLRTRHVWEMREGEAWTPVLDETWRVACRRPSFTDFEGPEASYILDFTSLQVPRVDIALPEYRYGGMAVRGARDWLTDRRRLKALTSEGKDLSSADSTRARWVDLNGPIGQREAGVALLEHPLTPRAPNLLRVPPDHPYAVFSPPKAGALKLDAGVSYRFRYRIIVHNGPAKSERLQREWEILSRLR